LLVEVEEDLQQDQMVLVEEEEVLVDLELGLFH
jgi:hypothetical protein